MIANLMSNETNDTLRLLRQASQGNQQVLDELLASYRERLKRMIRLRMDGRLRDRIDASDIIQEAYLDAFVRLEEYLRKPKASFFLWLRFLVGQKLIDLHRHHFGVKARDVRQEEFRLHHGVLPQPTSEVLAAQLLGHYTTPTQAAVRAEMKIRLQEALNNMDALDREIIALRHFEQLSNSEAAEELGLQKPAASKRYVRALRRLKKLLSGLGEDFAQA